jgi:hypothetical protein
MKIEQVLDHNARQRVSSKPSLDHLRVYEADGEGGHIVEHQMDRYGSEDAERHVFEAPTGAKPKLPAGHVLTHIAEAMNIPHETMAETGESEAHANPAAE